MVDYLSEEEQAEALRNWWRENRAWVLSGVVLGVALLVGWRYYQGHVTQRADNAAEVLRNFVAAVDAKDNARAEELFKELDGKYAATPYADQARLIRAQAHVSAGDFERAAAELKAAADGTDDKELKQVATLRLARVQIQLGKYDEVLALLDASRAGAFEAQVKEVRGDAFFARGDTAAARTEYQAALTATNAQSPGNRELLELKLQDLGTEPVEAQSTP